MFDLFGQPETIVLDLETTVKNTGGKTDNSPFNPDNRCVSGHWLTIDDLGQLSPVESRVFHHDEFKPDADTLAGYKHELQSVLDNCTTLVAHNAKFDCLWLLEMGFTLPDNVYCTMIGEYIYARGQFDRVSLAATAERRNVTRKKSDLVDEMFRKGIGFESMPLDTVIEYAEADVQSCAEIYIRQQEELELPENIGLKPVFRLMFDMLLFLIEIERNGIYIDQDALEEVRHLFQSEKDEIEKRLQEIVQSVMGDTPINLNSGYDMTKVVYSRTVTDRKLHCEMFQIGLGPSGKPLRRPKMNNRQFAAAVRATTAVMKKTHMECCPVCKGSGKQYKVTKKGEPYKKQPKCLECTGEGVVYLPTGQTAGLRLSPSGPHDASIGGFSCDKATIKRLIAQATDKGNDIAVEFLTKISRLNAVNTYLTSFVAGISRWTRADGLLHTTFNQTVAKTGRLSSTDPGFQNQPKGQKFPVRKCVVSRFDGGEVLEGDFSGLEFVVAGELSRDEQIIKDIFEGKDVHSQTASIVFEMAIAEVTKDLRQTSKKWTFLPLYGGQGMDEPAHVRRYIESFTTTLYPGVGVWHRQLMDGVLRTGIVRIPSGREYYWPNVRRYGNGQVSNATQIKNYPVQGFATGDIVPLACIRALRRFRKDGLRSLLILTVHDSIVVDVYPGEREQVVAALRWAMEEIKAEMFDRWNYEMLLPLRIEITSGPNWMEGNTIYPLN